MNALPYKLSAIAAGIAYAVSAAPVIGHRIPDSHWGTRGAVVDGAGAVALLLTAVALAGLAPMLSGGRLARWAARTAQAGCAAMATESVVSLVHGGTVLGGLFLGGLAAAVAGLITLAVSGLRAGRLRWAAGLPALGLLVGIAGGDRGGFLVTAVVWLVLGAIGAGRPVPAVASPTSRTA